MTEKTYEPLNITEYQRANLERLYAGTEEYEARERELGSIPFYMGSYSLADTPGEMMATECGTVACFAGHGPKVGIHPIESEGWDDYVDRVFGESSIEFVWLFGSGWTTMDDTLAGARRRLRLALDRGVPSDGWDQMSGIADYECAESSLSPADPAR